MDTFLLAMGFLFFVACFIWGLVLMVVPFRDPTRKNGLFYLELSFIGWLPILPFLPPIHLTLLSVSGTYIDDYGGGHSTYHLFPDGTLAQTFEKNGHVVYRNQGTWSLYEGDVSFEHFILPTGTAEWIETPKPSNFTGGALYLLSSDIGINEDAGIYLEKVEKGTLETLFPLVFWPLSGGYLYDLVRRFRTLRLRRRCQ